jgi:hypothetical protein
MENEDEDTLKTVEYRESIGHHDELSVDIENTDNPSRSKKHHENDCTLDPHPDQQTTSHFIRYQNSNENLLGLI